MNLLTEPWSIEFHSGIPVYRQIINYLRAAMADGRLRQDEQLPTVRALHKKLNVNPNTVAKAYRELELGGFITTQRGSGCFVAAPPVAPKLSAQVKRAKADELSSRIVAEARSHGIPLQTLIQNLTQIKAHG
jgi:GntR family transcriptional regulator